MADTDRTLTECRIASPWTQYDVETGVRTVRCDERGVEIVAAWVTHAGARRFQTLGGPVMEVRHSPQPDPLEAAKVAADHWLRGTGWVLTDA